MKIIAVDFDGCLCEAKWPDIGAPRQQVINELIRQQTDGAKLILWTCREGEQLQAAVMWCLNHGLKFDAVNDNLPENIDKYGNNCRKVWATEYWDDKNVCIIGRTGHEGILRVDRDGYPVVRSAHWGSIEQIKERAKPMNRLKDHIAGAIWWRKFKKRKRT